MGEFKNTILDTLFLLGILAAFAWGGFLFGILCIVLWGIISFYTDRFSTNKNAEETRIKDKMEKNATDKLLRSIDEKIFKRIENSKVYLDDTDKIERIKRSKEYFEGLPSNENIKKNIEELEFLEKELESKEDVEFSLKQKNITTTKNREIFDEARSKYKEIYPYFDKIQSWNDQRVNPIKEEFDKNFSYLVHSNIYGYDDTKLRKETKEDIKKIKEKRQKIKKMISEKIKNQTITDARKIDKARIASHDKKSREIAKNITVKKTHNCPYCGNSLGDLPHQDHIYPIAKGGMSVEKNLVYVCQNCNLKKRDLTLNQFINMCGLDREFIENNLRELGKDF